MPTFIVTAKTGDRDNPCIQELFIQDDEPRARFTELCNLFNDVTLARVSGKTGRTVHIASQMTTPTTLPI